MAKSHTSLYVTCRWNLHLATFDTLLDTLRAQLSDKDWKELNWTILATISGHLKTHCLDPRDTRASSGERIGFFPLTTSLTTLLPLTAFPRFASPPLLNFELNPYQCAAISWMHHIEHTPGPQRYVSELPMIFGPMLQHGLAPSANWLQEDQPEGIALRYNHITFVKRDVLDTHASYQREFFCRGGVLADGTGLGKTVTILAHILNTLPAAPTSLKLYGGSKRRFQTRASLVIVPNSIAAQWHVEAQRFAGGKMNILYVTKKLDWAKVTNGDLMRAGLVIVTAEYLVRNLTHGRPLNDEGEMLDHLKSLAETAKDAPDFLTQPAQYLELFEYQRIILDEAHLLLDERLYQPLTKPLAILHGIAYWAVTATPPILPHTLLNFLRFLRLRPQKHDVMCREFTRAMEQLRDYWTALSKVQNTLTQSEVGCVFELQALVRAFVRHFVWRNTQSNVEHSTRESFTIPIARQRICVVTLSAEEELFVKAFTTLARFHASDIYPPSMRTAVGYFHNATRNVYLTCSRPCMAPNFRPTNGDMITRDEETCHIRSQQQSEQWPQLTRSLVHNLVDIHYRLERVRVALDLEYFNPTIERVEGKLRELALEIRIHPGRFRLLADWMRQRAVHTENVQAREAMARLSEHINTSCDALTAAYPKWTDSKLDTSNLSLFQQACLSFGTKAASVAHYLQSIFAASTLTHPVRVLLFSQFMETLENFQGLLNFMQVGALIVRGHVDQKTRAIREFKSGAVQALLIPIDKNAAGLHLVSASHVVLLDPVMDVSGAATELQAVSRAIRRGQTKPVEVVRFIVRGTPEHEMVKKTLVGTKLCEEVDYPPTMLV